MHITLTINDVQTEYYVRAHSVRKRLVGNERRLGWIAESRATLHLTDALRGALSIPGGTFVATIAWSSSLHSTPGEAEADLWEHVAHALVKSPAEPLPAALPPAWVDYVESQRSLLKDAQDPRVASDLADG